jgi:hypothetical protein
VLSQRKGWYPNREHSLPNLVDGKLDKKASLNIVIVSGPNREQGRESWAELSPPNHSMSHETQTPNLNPILSQSYIH